LAIDMAGPVRSSYDAGAGRRAQADRDHGRLAPDRIWRQFADAPTGARVLESILAERPPARPRVGLFVTCLVDLFRPTVGFAAAKLLEDAGCEVVVPPQTCCGQPAFNSGDRRSARDLALQVMDAFQGCDYVVAPSGSCGGMIARHYPELFDEPQLARRARDFAARSHELVSFLTDVLGVASVDAAYEGRATYHDSCSGLRELGVRGQPRALLKSVRGLELVEMPESDVCCGFGGTFAAKYGEISDAIVRKKVAHAQESGAPLLLAGDLGCLMNMAGKLSREGSRMEVRHVAEVLAGLLDAPPIGAPAKDAERAR
jgi:L-lactate dehydrogenase complex protein LldE